MVSNVPDIHLGIYKNFRISTYWFFTGYAFAGDAGRSAPFPPGEIGLKQNSSRWRNGWPKRSPQAHFWRQIQTSSWPERLFKKMPCGCLWSFSGNALHLEFDHSTKRLIWRMFFWRLGQETITYSRYKSTTPGFPISAALHCWTIVDISSALGKTKLRKNKII